MREFKVGDEVCTKYPIHIEKTYFGYNTEISPVSILKVARIYPNLEELDVFVHHLQSCPDDPYLYRLGFHEIHLYGRETEI